MNKFLVCLLWLFLCSVSLGRDKKMPPSPIFLDATSVAIFNQTGILALSDKVYTVLMKWGRYRIIHDADEADLVFVISNKAEISGYKMKGSAVSAGGNLPSLPVPVLPGTPKISAGLGRASGSSKLLKETTTYVHIIDRTTDEIIWADSRRAKLKDKGKDSKVKQIIKELKKRVEKMAKRKNKKS